MPTTILASRYNNLRDQVNLILGPSNPASPTYGYGQAFSTNRVLGSRTVADISHADKVTAEQYEDLYIDLIRTRAHQIGPAISIDDFLIGDFESNPETADKIEEAYVIGLESLATNIATDRLTVHPNNLSLAPLVSSSFSNTWFTQITHIFTVTFATEEDRRHFFNAGGEIRVSASVDYTGSQAKTVDWQTILNAMGTTSFKAEETVNNAGVGSGSNIGNYDLTPSYQLIYSRSGGSVYARNRYNVYAAESATTDDTSQIIFKIDFVDGAPNDTTYGIDEFVLGTFNSVAQTATPDGQIEINGTIYPTVTAIDDPVAANVRTLS
jgi:hypothetical protein